MGSAGADTSPRLLDPQSTAAVVLGAHDWTEAGLDRAPSFLRSARSFVRYLYDPRGLGIDPELVFDLFDDPAGAGDQLGRLRDTLDVHLRDRRMAGRPVRDVLVYYIGHGYCDDHGHLSLLVRRSRRGLEAETGIKAADLARTLRLAAPQQRRSVILDCCFSEAAAKAFVGMGADLNQQIAATAINDLKDDQPTRGTLLLCSSPVGRVSMGAPNAKHTLFSGAVLDVLCQGSNGRPPFLSFADLRDDAFELMVESFGANAPRPVLHQVNAAHGDLTRAPAFLNHALQTQSQRNEAYLQRETALDRERPAERGLRLEDEMNRKVAETFHVPKSKLERPEPQRLRPEEEVNRKAAEDLPLPKSESERRRSDEKAIAELTLLAEAEAPNIVIPRSSLHEKILRWKPALRLIGIGSTLFAALVTAVFLYGHIFPGDTGRATTPQEQSRGSADGAERNKQTSDPVPSAEASSSTLANPIPSGQASDKPVNAAPSDQIADMMTALRQQQAANRLTNVWPSATPQPSQPSSPCGDASVSLASAVTRKPAPLSAAEECAFKPGGSFKECDDCPEMVVVPPSASFTMGTARDDRVAALQRTVSILQPFAVGKFETTFAEWNACAEGGGCKSNPKPSDNGWGRGNHPVINVSWKDAQQYLAWLYAKTGKTYRFLSEVEWEYASRANTPTIYTWGNEIGRNKANCADCGSPWDKRSAPVGSFAANPFGIYDMAGNVWEHVGDCWNNTYENAPKDGTAWEAGDCSRRVIRGGSWFTNHRLLQPSQRDSDPSGYSNPNVGLRVARSL
jgi:formylglycine-generating enzyme required for sulfatase activity